MVGQYSALQGVYKVSRSNEYPKHGTDEHLSQYEISGSSQDVLTNSPLDYS